MWKQDARAREIWAAMERMERAGFRAEVNRFVAGERTVWTAAATDGRSTWAMSAHDPVKAMNELLDRLGLVDAASGALN